MRRILTYVVPDPGKPPKAATAVSAAANTAPAAGEVVLGVLTRLRSTDSVSRELQEIRDNNTAARACRRARATLATAMLGTPELARALWPSYRAERLRSTASTIGRLITAGQPSTANLWSEREITAALTRHTADPQQDDDFAPPKDMVAALAQTGDNWRWGQTTVLRLSNITIDVLKRAVWLAPFGRDEQKAIVKTREKCVALLTQIRADLEQLNTFWTNAPQRPISDDAGMTYPTIPPRTGAPHQPATDLDALDQWIGLVLPRWTTVAAPAPADGVAGTPTTGTATPAPVTPPPDSTAAARRSTRYNQSLNLAEHLLDRRLDIASILQNPDNAIDPDGHERAQLRALYQWLFESPNTDDGSQATAAGDPAVDVSALTPQDVLNRMLRLHVVQLATAGALEKVEQEVELVQISCSTPTAITGMQLHHFGAFYRATWRVNDWIQGRLDGAEQIMRLLLSPERLRQWGYTTDKLLTKLKQIATPDHPHQQWLTEQWESNQTDYQIEVANVINSTTETTALTKVAAALALPLQLQILTEDLDVLAAAIKSERDLNDIPDRSKQWLDAYNVKNKASTEMSAGELWDLRNQLTLIGAETIVDDVGTDTFARTVSQAATVAASTFGLPPKLSSRAVRFALSTTRGYTLLVWAMIRSMTMGNSFGAQVVDLAVAAGATLLAVTILIPGIPIGVTLVGVLVLLAGITAAALRTKDTHRLAMRIAVAGLLVAAVLGFLIWRDIHLHGLASTVIPMLIKLGVGVLIVALGWFFAGTHSSIPIATQRHRPISITRRWRRRDKNAAAASSQDGSQ